MKRNEEQQRRLKMSKAHLVYAILFFILIVLGGRFIGGPALAFMGAAWGGIISAVWIAFAYGLYEDSKDPMVGRPESHLPKELQELINQKEVLEEQNAQNERFHS